MKSRVKNIHRTIFLGLSIVLSATTVIQTRSLGQTAFFKQAVGFVNNQRAATAGISAADFRKNRIKVPKKPVIKPLAKEQSFGYIPVDKVQKLNEQRIDSTNYGTYMIENIRAKDSMGNLVRKYPTQDRVFVGGLLGKQVFAVCDGHGDQGDIIADLVINKLLISAVNSKKIVTGFYDASKKMQDALIKNSQAFRSGTTFLAAVIDNNLLTVAHVGDSRLIVVRPSENKVILATKDHKATAYTGLALSRAFGDVDMFNRGYTTAIPDVRQEALQEGDYLVLASDGYWDVFNNHETLKLIMDAQKAQKSCKEMAQGLAESARARKSRDDISVVVVRYGQDTADGFGSGV